MGALLLELLLKLSNHCLELLYLFGALGTLVGELLLQLCELILAVVELGDELLQLYLIVGVKRLVAGVPEHDLLLHLRRLGLIHLDFLLEDLVFLLLLFEFVGLLLVLKGPFVLRDNFLLQFDFGLLGFDDADELGVFLEQLVELVDVGFEMAQFLDFLVLLDDLGLGERDLVDEVVDLLLECEVAVLELLVLSVDGAVGLALLGLEQIEPGAEFAIFYDGELELCGELFDDFAVGFRVGFEEGVFAVVLIDLLELGGVFELRGGAVRRDSLARGDVVGGEAGLILDGGGEDVGCVDRREGGGVQTGGIHPL